MNSPIRTGQSTAADPAAAVGEFFEAVRQPDMALVCFFCSSQYDLDAVAAGINRLFPQTMVIGCTTAGEIGPAGYREHSIAGFSLPRGSCAAVADRHGPLQSFDFAVGQAFAHRLADRLDGLAPGVDSRFALLLVDGLSMREEPVAQAFQAGLGLVPLVGGSAGDDARFERTWVFHDGAFHGDSAVLAVVSTQLPMRTFMAQHFVCGEERLVVTAADPATRNIAEINGRPAVQEYARLVGTDAAHLDAAAFAAAPLLVVLGGNQYVRAIQKANPDGSLTLFSAIEEGVVLRIGRPTGLARNLAEQLGTLEREIGRPQLVIACDCVLRNREAAATGEKAEVAALLRNHRAVGFSTYGEQYQGIHVNQTLTGIAVGTAEAANV